MLADAPPYTPHIFWIWPFAGLLLSIALLQTVLALRRRTAGYKDSLWLLYLAFAPPALMFGFSQWIPVYLERALLPSGAIFCIWLAWSLVETRPPKAIAVLSSVLLALGFTLGLYQHITNVSFPYAPFAVLVDKLEAGRQAGDGIVHSSKLSMLPSIYFDRSLPETFVADPPGTAVDTLAPATQEVIGVRSVPDIQSAAGDAPRIWYIIFDESNREYLQAGYPRHPDLTWLMQRYRLLEISHVGDLSVYLFSKSQ